MQFRKQQEVGPDGTARARPPLSLNWARAFVYLGAMAVFMDLAVIGQQQVPSLPHRPPPPPEASGLPDANDRMRMREEHAKVRNFAAANAERKRQITDDSAKLLSLAADLKAEMDKAGKDTLWLNVILKADEIERLAHNVKQKMILTVGGG